MSSNSAEKLDQLFPVPSPPPSQVSPQRLAGASLETLAALQHVLKDNHQRYHIFYNDINFHNHISHRALAIYSLGGPASVIKDYYESDGTIQLPARQSPGPITEENFLDHIGDEDYYQGYVAFFSNRIAEKGAANTLEEFVFSDKYNFVEGRDADAQPEMLARFYQGLIHPMIHVGYGTEFGLKGMLVEGLAMTAVHRMRVKRQLPRSFFAPSSTNVAEQVASRLSSLALEAPATSAPVASKTDGVHVFDVVARLLKDGRVSRMTVEDYDNRFTERFTEYLPIVWEHVESWTVDLSQSDEVDRKMEELIWLSSLLYGAGGLTSSRFLADFFLMHAVTSSLFLPSLLAYLSPRSQVRLLRSYLNIVLIWWLMRGRPAPNVKLLMSTTSVESPLPTTPAPGTPLTTATTAIPNPFLPILQSAIAHPYDHVPKIQRAFAHFDTLYGRRAAGYFAGTELEGAKLLDGSLFLRAALLTAGYVGWAREGQEARQFYREWLDV